MREELEQKPATGGPFKKYVSDNGIRWSSLKSCWHNEPWSFAKWRLSQVKPRKTVKQKPIEGRGQGCLHAGIAADVLHVRSMMAVGFGGVSVTASGVCLWSGDNPEYRVARVEALAAKHPRHDWRITWDGPLSGKTYQRVGTRKWVLVEQNRGFA